MQQDTYTTKVVFLLEQNAEGYTMSDGVFAFFPEEAYNEDVNLRSCYAHVGQHSACHVDYASGCKLASKVRYAPLKAELEGLGYVLEVLTEVPDLV